MGSIFGSPYLGKLHIVYTNSITTVAASIAAITVIASIILLTLIARIISIMNHYLCPESR